MKANCLNRIETLTAALLLALVLGCGESKPPAPEPKAATPPPAAAATPAAAPAPTPAAPAAPAAETPSAAAPASGAMRYDAASTGSKMKIEGTSNIHDWNMESAVVGGFLEADAKFPEATGGAVKAEVFMPVRSFKSTSKMPSCGVGAAQDLALDLNGVWFPWMIYPKRGIWWPMPMKWNRGHSRTVYCWSKIRIS